VGLRMPGNQAPLQYRGSRTRSNYIRSPTYRHIIYEIKCNLKIWIHKKESEKTKISVCGFGQERNPRCHSYNAINIAIISAIAITLKLEIRILGTGRFTDSHYHRNVLWAHVWMKLDFTPFC
jgi:hypothetical protein